MTENLVPEAALSALWAGGLSDMARSLRRDLGVSEGYTDSIVNSAVQAAAPYIVAAELDRLADIWTEADEYAEVVNALRARAHILRGRGDEVLPQ